MDPYAAEEAAARSTRVWPWWVVVVPLTVTFALLWWLALRPLEGVFAPSWQPTTWHLLDVHEDRLVLMVEFLDCGGIGVEEPPVRVDVEESATTVAVAAFYAGEAVPIPTACFGHQVTSTTVQLDAPLGARTLDGCRHEHSGLLDEAPDGCAELADEFGL